MRRSGSMWLLLVLAVPAYTAEKAYRVDPALARQAGKAVDRAVAYLRGSQSEDGSFGEGEHRPAITGLVLTSLLRSQRVTVVDPLAARALKYLEGHVQPDGGIYTPKGRRNYPTAIALMAFAEANKDGRYRSVVQNAVAFLKKEQWDESEGITPDNPKYGGAGYGRKTRPDLSNTGFLLDALQAGGLPKDDPAYKRAILFISRCQNFSAEGANDLPQGKLINDGGFYYTPAENYNPGGGTETTGLRSYGSMTYQGLKSFIYAGVDKDDPRVKAAWGWIRKHYTLQENPGLGQQGLFYYYHTFAKALAAMELNELIDNDGQPHDWRAELVRSLLERQHADGSWANTNKRWFENDPRLVTSYALLALSHALN